MTFWLAILPAIALLIFIYKKDKREKEPIKLLLSCFAFGIIAIFPIMLMETVLEGFFEIFLVPGSVMYAIVDGFIIAAFSEELFKYIVLKNRTWKSEGFNCTFDGIVYSMFVSLGFAAFENILYLIDGNISDAILRMFTAVPGHACDAVFMGYYYSRAKVASINNDRFLEKKSKKKALFVPILFHGIYDCLIMVDEEVAGEGVVIAFILLWIAVVICEFVFAFIIVQKSSKNDMILIGPAEVENDFVRSPFIMKNGNWICSCRYINNGNYCAMCGAKRLEKFR